MPNICKHDGCYKFVKKGESFCNSHNSKMKVLKLKITEKLTLILTSVKALYSKIKGK